ncbi:MAG: enoyl-CoA hydratase/isomerase family protein [Betaproteobacteria bacterium]|nr:enoyl-CoA hydratase/isomerase family protein [Betaproteobacteria bacterium]
MNDAILLERHGALATLTLNRPESLNALDFSMMQAFVARSHEIAADRSLRCVILRGAGAHFMAGGDLRTFATQLGMPPAERQAAFTKTVDDLHAAIEMLRRMPQIVIASVHGAVAGFGLSLMSCCDLAVAAEESYFTSAYRHIGLTPDGGGTYFLPRLVGLKKAMEIMLLGERFNAAEALRLGLVNRVVPQTELAAATEALAQGILSGPFAALSGAKRLLNQSLEARMSEQLHAEALSFGACTATRDFAEGIQAFLEKRPAKFD